MYYLIFSSNANYMVPLHAFDKLDDTHFSEERTREAREEQIRS